MDVQDNRGRWIVKRRRVRHDCEDHLPLFVPAYVPARSMWVCPECNRRWRLMWIGDNSGALSEGVTIHGPDDSTYWRPSRTRFTGWWIA